MRRVEKEMISVVLTANLVDSTTRGDVERGSGGVVAEDPFKHVNQSLGCSQVENELEERDAMDLLMDDEMISVKVKSRFKRREAKAGSFKVRKCTKCNRTGLLRTHK